MRTFVMFSKTWSFLCWRKLTRTPLTSIKFLHTNNILKLHTILFYGRLGDLNSVLILCSVICRSIENYSGIKISKVNFLWKFKGNQSKIPYSTARDLKGRERQTSGGLSFLLLWLKSSSAILSLKAIQRVYPLLRYRLWCESEVNSILKIEFVS